jgi:hypothetical protein
VGDEIWDIVPDSPEDMTPPRAAEIRSSPPAVKNRAMVGGSSIMSGTKRQDRRKLRDDQITDLHRDRLAGMKLEAIGTKYGISAACAHKYFHMKCDELRGFFIASRRHLDTKHQQKGGTK